jgi:hypothetical protein
MYLIFLIEPRHIFFVAAFEAQAGMDEQWPAVMGGTRTVLNVFEAADDQPGPWLADG